MSIDETFDAPWTRKHDDPRTALLAQVPRTVYPGSLAELITLCRDGDGAPLRAAGSHWALSDAAISDNTFVETHDPHEQRPAMGRTLPEVVPGCLNPAYVQHMVDAGWDEPWMLTHIEAGKRIYQLYAELDRPADPTDTTTLTAHINSTFDPHPDFTGPWAFPTLGGAGGQTVVGALNTGTHGGDFDRPPVADSVLAMHLVADGGRQYWIEPDDPNTPQLTDDDLLKARYDTPELGGPDNFEVIRDNDVFDAALVSVGRFGIIYSIVVKAVPQFALVEKRRLHLWQDVRDQIRDRTGPLYADQRPSNAIGEQHFLQIAVSLTTHAAFTRNLAGVTKRYNAQLSSAVPGHAERVGDPVGGVVDPFLQAQRFAMAGASHPFTPDEDNPQRGGNPSVLERACADSSFLVGILTQAIDEIEKLVESDGAIIGTGIVAATAIGAGGLLLLLPALFAILLLLRELLELIDDDTRFGEVMNAVKDKLLDPDADPETRAAGLFAWQLIYYLAFADQQSDQDYTALSYAVMDQHDYLDRSCNLNVYSIEVFFDAVDDRLVAFVDALIAFETAQEFEGLACLGYASLRFTGPTRALIGMQQWATSCAIEVACLRDVTGGQQLIDFAAAFAGNPNIGGVLHWGQHNTQARDQIERSYGTRLATWRDALARIGADRFSTAFSRRTGLEPV